MLIVLSPGTIIDGKYRVVRLLGQGGMGAVYEGQNLRIDRRIAIKVMHASIARDRDHVARFEREAQAAARIGSSHIVDVFDLGDLPGGERFMVMEYIEGESLMERLKAHERFAAPVIAAIGIQLLEGLAKVHQAGIVHRDLKPANVFLAQTEGGGDFVKILDFGVCKILQARKSGELSTGVGDLLGTPSYMSPEQLEHGPNKLDGRSDLYAVGVILYRGVSGRLPYQARNLVELLYKLREGEADPLETVIDVDAGFAAIVKKATEWDPAARFQTAREFQRALGDWLTKSSRVEGLLAEFLEVPHLERPPTRTAPPRAPSIPPQTAAAKLRLHMQSFPPPPAPALPAQFVPPAAASQPRLPTPSVPPPAASKPTLPTPSVPPAAASKPTPPTPSVPPAAASKPTPSVPPAAESRPSRLPPPRTPQRRKSKPPGKHTSKDAVGDVRATVPDVRGALTVPDESVARTIEVIPRVRRNTRKMAEAPKVPSEDVPISVDFEEDAATIPKPDRGRRNPHRR